MVPCARAFLFKHAPLQAWLDYTSTYGLPGVRGITSALRGTPEFEDMEDALAKFMEELAVVTNSSESIDVLDLKGGGEPPFARLVDRMDRVMASLWRGADLSTISRDQGYGASLQEQEAGIRDSPMVRAKAGKNLADKAVFEHVRRLTAQASPDFAESAKSGRFQERRSPATTYR